MPIRVECRSCGAVMRASERANGRTLPCAKCGRPIFVSQDAGDQFSFAGGGPTEPVENAPQLSAPDFVGPSDDFDSLLGQFPPLLQHGSPFAEPAAPPDPRAWPGSGAPHVRPQHAVRNLDPLESTPYDQTARPQLNANGPGGFAPQGFNTQQGFGSQQGFAGQAPPGAKKDESMSLSDILAGVSFLIVAGVGILALCTLWKPNTNVMGTSPGMLMLYTIGSLVAGIAFFGNGWEGVKNKRLANSAKSAFVTGVTHIEGQKAVVLGWMHLAIGGLFLVIGTVLTLVTGVAAVIVLLR